jgi:formate dehydrogenase subunit delta
MQLDSAAEITMANKIAAHFGYLEFDEAADAVANHLDRFWDPRMKRRLRDMVAAGAGDLDPVAAAAVGRLR